jgi:hypothetical protein
MEDVTGASAVELVPTVRGTAPRDASWTSKPPVRSPSRASGKRNSPAVKKGGRGCVPFRPFLPASEVRAVRL